MNNYKSTLNLPKTTFPMKGNLPIQELKILQKWTKNHIYQKIRKKKLGNPIFFLHDGPPYANGNIHIGHALNKILKDIILKSKHLSGFDAPYIPGWDCHGLPIEQQVEKILHDKKKTVSNKVFRIMCREYAQQQINNQKKDFIRLGVFGDWNQSYQTMDFKSEADIVRILSKIIFKGHIYQGLKPVHWCLNCKSALADAEVEHIEKKSYSILFKLKICNQGKIHQKLNMTNFKKPIYFVVWTTTPWSLPASQALAIHEKYEYQLIETSNQALIITRNRTEDIMKNIKVHNWKIIKTMIGTTLEKLDVIHPLFKQKIPIIISQHVSQDMGSGIVHIAPDHGVDDFLACQPYDIQPINLINQDGNYINTPYSQLNNINITYAHTLIIDMLKEKNILLSVKQIIHNYPHCWRHKTPIIFRTTPQWFISMSNKNLKQESLNSLKTVKWIPNWGFKRITSMLSQRPDWCISRQRKWGVPLPLFIHKKTKKLHPKTQDLIKKIAHLIELQGIEAWWEIDTKKILGNDYKEYIKVEDVIDVWFDSGSSQHFFNFQNNFKNHTAADMYLEGSDQHRGWFMSSLIISTAIQNKAPYSTVLTHGFIVDETKKKMSKSIGNTLSPNYIIDNFGADILRLWVASTDYTKDITISNEILQQSIENYRKIRNTIRFILSNLNSFNPSTDIVQPNNMIKLDKWIINKTKNIQEDIIQLYEKYKFHEVLQKIMNFCSIELSSFYFEIIKDRQYTNKKNSIPYLSGQTTIFHIIHALVRWITPILSFTSEEIWECIPGTQNSIFIEEWYKKLFYMSKTEILSDTHWNLLIQIKYEVNKHIEQQRKIKNIRNSLECHITLYVKTKLFNILSILNNELKFIFITSYAIIKKYNLAPNTIKPCINIPELKIETNIIVGKKCLRCWHYTDYNDPLYNNKDICYRCTLNIEGSGETRYYC
ncbi:MAG: isoleucine--tRNA ligase [Buchnera aphidicola (Eriosoma harunire)]